MRLKKIIFLYTELATYFLACIEKLRIDSNVGIYIIHWPLNKEAPFRFNIPEGVTLYEKNNFSFAQLTALINDISPDIIYCSGWMDKDYVKICKSYKDKVPIIVGFDNRWNGTLKQQIARLVSPFTIMNYFSHAWIPGESQHAYAKKLGFKEQNILKGFYSADFDLFHQQYLSNKEQKQKHFPKRFIYVGRYIEHKGIKDLWKAFVELQNECPNEWELWCLGTGDLQGEAMIHPKIKHFGFVQPGDMANYIRETGVFILPSHFEPWGVVVHEFAAAGFPMICSHEVGAASTFLEHENNGYIFQSGNIRELKDCMRKTMAMTTEELSLMGERSVEKAKQITPEKWADTLKGILNFK